MQQTGKQSDPELRLVVREAAHALATLDADRLEELALSCPALSRNFICAESARSAELTRQASDAIADMAIFARVLEVTRANLNVMNRLRLLRQGPAEYGQDGSMPARRN